MSEDCNNCHECLKDKVIEHPGGLKQPVTSSRMILCPDCGNKRCPKATNHRFPCTGSNEQGQPGSSTSMHGLTGSGKFIPTGRRRRLDGRTDVSKGWVPQIGQLIRWLEDSSGRAGEWAVIIEYDRHALTRHDCGLVVCDWNCEPILPANSSLTLDQAWEEFLKITTGDDEEMPPIKNPHIRYLHLFRGDTGEEEDYQGMVMLTRKPDGTIALQADLHYSTYNSGLRSDGDEANDRVRKVYGALRTWIEGVPVGG